MSDIRRQLDALYVRIDDLCQAERWADVDAVLVELADEPDLTLRIGALTITCRAQPHLRQYGPFARETARRAREAGRDAERLLQGLWWPEEGT